MINSEEDRQVADLFFGQVAIARPLIGPPGMRAPIVAALRRAMAEAVKDKELLADAAKIGLDIDPMSPEATEEALARFYRTPQAVVARAVAIMGRK